MPWSLRQSSLPPRSAGKEASLLTRRRHKRALLLSVVEIELSQLQMSLMYRGRREKILFFSQLPIISYWSAFSRIFKEDSSTSIHSPQMRIINNSHLRYSVVERRLSSLIYVQMLPTAQSPGEERILSSTLLSLWKLIIFQDCSPALFRSCWILIYSILRKVVILTTWAELGVESSSFFSAAGSSDPACFILSLILSWHISIISCYSQIVA